MSRLKARNKKLQIAIAVIVVLALAGLGYWYFKRDAEPEAKFRPVKIERGDLSVSILTTGTVSPENRLEIKPPIAGRVEQVLVKEGLKVKKGQVLAWMSSTERAALLDSARAKGPDELKRWEELYRPTPVLAPINGMIILRSVEPGQTFAATEALLVMSDRLTIKAQVDETDMAQVKLGQAATIVLDAYAKQPIPGRVDQIAYDAKSVNNVTTYVVDVLPNETPEFVRSGMTANINFFIENRKNVVIIPAEAIRTSDNGRMVALVEDPNGGKPVEKPIKVGLSDGKRTEILSGLTEGETVLVAQLSSRRRDDSGNSNPFNPMGRRPPGGSGGGKR